MAASMTKLLAFRTLLPRANINVFIRKFATGNEDHDPAFKYNSEFFWRHSLAQIAARRKMLGLSTDIEEKFEPITDVEESSVEWPYVERLLPMDRIPTPPPQDQYPTPSGWVPQAEKLHDLPYYVRRTRLHDFPIYFTHKYKGTRKYTRLNSIEGDIWALERDLKEYLEGKCGKRLKSQVQEAAMYVRFKGGDFTNDVKQWLINNGF